MILFLALCASSAAASSCVLTTTIPAPPTYPPDPPDPLCAYASTALLAGTNLTWAGADEACITSADRPLACGEVVPLFAAPADSLLYTTCLPLRGCASDTLITPSFRFSTLLNTLEVAAVVAQPYWSFADQGGQFSACGMGDPSSTTLFSNSTAANCAMVLPVVCLCMNSTSPTMAPTASPTPSAPTLPTFFPTSLPTLLPTWLPSRAPTILATLFPTWAPSKSPSKAPSTSHPSHSPSKAPSTSLPSRSPSKAPSTDKPSRSPSKTPSTSTPSRSPSKSPSVSPNSIPSLIPSRFPSRSPTSARPSRAPHSSAPSDAPTWSPTFAASVLLYSTNAAYAATNLSTNICSGTIESISLSCESTYPLICSLNGGVDVFPTTYGFNASLPVKGPTGIVISATWPALFGGLIDTSLEEANVLAPCGSTFYTGCDAIGDTAQTCNDWSSTSALDDATLGSEDSVESSFIGDGVGNCSLARPVVCICVGGMF